MTPAPGKSGISECMRRRAITWLSSMTTQCLGATGLRARRGFSMTRPLGRSLVLELLHFEVYGGSGSAALFTSLGWAAGPIVIDSVPNLDERSMTTPRTTWL